MKHRWALTGLAVPLLLTACASAGQPGTARGTAPAGTAPQGTAASGTVTGMLVMEGGPLGPGGQQPRARRIPGTIQFSRGRQLITVQTERSGMFSVSLPPGTYHVTAHSPRVQAASNGKTRLIPCGSAKRVTVTVGHRTALTLACIVP